MAEGQMYNPTLPSCDLVDDNYKEALTDKVDKLLKQCRSDIKKMKTIKEKSINRVVTETALRRNKGKGHNLDQRRKSPTKYKEKGLLTGTTGTLEENLIPGHDYYKTCHDEQYKLFNELSIRFPETVFLTNVEQRKDERGRWYLYRNDEKLDITQFLDVIDNITLEYIKQLSVIQEKKPDHDLQTIAESCKTIVMARYLNDMNPGRTDLMKDNETKLLRNNRAVIFSFAALWVILEMIKLTNEKARKPEEPKQINQTIKLTNEQWRKPEEPKRTNQTIERTNEQPRKHEEPKRINQTIEQTNEQGRKPEEPKQINQTIELTNEQPRKPEEHWFLTTVLAFILIGYFLSAIYTCLS
ncbi:PREDICTED: uncharacterized protein LOC107353706 [Acropora digitifera]|uniref:uncharacterized protein LOC107353706 n=1 Tax=Acropora digitifera TaxID=70779 RepID=UPI00077A4B71|nr:PREDICTED: uncharacterized protein LOC107353706 [Acropora digitifera]XP_015775549.1 PREDICTED: uncharacterized protein LOC107353706 [Acropora digitifera]XP_015775550.1 PREDICTED: uncharacterized protein LOC107353706 [Acropora digitifera]XP_015775551.1 PREDICTED: uncharacterized protein LOC107353706 [Acropora digitifera]